MSDVEALAAALARRQARTQMVREQAGREMDGPGWREQLSRLTGAMLTAPGSPGRELFNSALAGMRSIAPGGESYANELGYIRQEAEDQHPGAYSVVPDVRRLAQVMANREDMTNMAPGLAAGLRVTGPERAANFRKWFGDSQVTRTLRNGEEVPLKVAHSTDADFDTFAAGELGFHFGDKAAAKQIGGRRLIEGYLSMKRPFHMRDAGTWGRPEIVINELERHRGTFSPEEIAALREQTRRLEAENAHRLTDEAYDSGSLDYKLAQYEITAPIRDALKAKGYDGIVYPNAAEGFSDSFIAFEPTQFKSTRNRGTFDPNDPNFNHAYFGFGSGVGSDERRSLIEALLTGGR